MPEAAQVIPAPKPITLDQFRQLAREKVQDPDPAYNSWRETHEKVAAQGLRGQAALGAYATSLFQKDPDLASRYKITDFEITQPVAPPIPPPEKSIVEKAKDYGGKASEYAFSSVLTPVQDTLQNFGDVVTPYTGGALNVFAPGLATTYAAVAGGLKHLAPPIVSAVGSVAGAVGLPGVENQFQSLAKSVSGSGQGMQDFASGLQESASNNLVDMASPAGIALWFGSGGFSRAAAKFPAAAKFIYGLARTTSAGTSLTELLKLKKEVPGLADAVEKGDWREAGRLAGNVVFDATIGVGAGLHAVKGAKAPPTEPPKLGAKTPSAHAEAAIPKLQDDFAVSTEKLKSALREAGVEAEVIPDNLQTLISQIKKPEAVAKVSGFANQYQLDKTALAQAADRAYGTGGPAKEAVVAGRPSNIPAHEDIQAIAASSTIPYSELMDLAGKPLNDVIRGRAQMQHVLNAVTKNAELTRTSTQGAAERIAQINQLKGRIADYSKVIAAKQAPPGKPVMAVTTDTAPVAAPPLYEKFRAQFGAPPISAPIDASAAVSKKNFSPPLSVVDKAVTPEGNIKLGADVASLGEILGSSLYQQNPAKVVPKELLQNAFDAVRGVQGGKVNVLVDSPTKSLVISDNGPGMTRDMLGSVFTDLGASGKRGQASASGGFGLAKAAPLMMSEELTVSTVTREANGQLMRHEFTATPDQLTGSGVKITSTPVPAGTPTGTSITSKLGKKFESWDSEHAALNYGKSIRPPGELEVRRGSERAGVPHHVLPSRGWTEPPTLIHSERIGDTADVDIYTTNRQKEMVSNPWGITVEVNNNGIYQFDRSIHTQAKGLSGVPDRVAIDVKSLVKEGHPDYPFTANREEIRDSIMAKVDAVVKEKIERPAIDAYLKSVGALYESMPLFKGTSRPFHVYDAGGRFTPEEFSAIEQHPEIRRLAATVGDVTDNILGTLRGHTETALGPLKGISDATEKIGFVFDDKLLGINIANPAKENVRSVFVNPFNLGENPDPYMAASQVWHTLKHEVLHNKISGHNESFTSAEALLSRLLGKLEIPSLRSLADAYGESGSDKIRKGIAEAIRTYRNSRVRPARTTDVLGGEALMGVGRSGPAGSKANNPPGVR